MEFFEYWADSLSVHASDADYRKQIDSEERPRHYIDIDNYPEFLESGMINHNFDSLVVIHGYNFVMEQGILPWAILKSFDSLQTSFEKGNWHSAMLHASDLGHYIGDSNMPLHLTRNYNGQFTGQYGIHSRYESNMISQYSNQIIYEGDTIKHPVSGQKGIVVYFPDRKELTDQWCVDYGSGIESRLCLQIDKGWAIKHDG